MSWKSLVTTYTARFAYGFEGVDNEFVHFTDAEFWVKRDEGPFLLARRNPDRSVTVFNCSEDKYPWVSAMVYDVAHAFQNPESPGPNTAGKYDMFSAERAWKPEGNITVHPLLLPEK